MECGTRDLVSSGRGGGIHKMILLNIHNGDEPAEKIDLALNVLKDANVYVEALLLTRHVRT